MVHRVAHIAFERVAAGMLSCGETRYNRYTNQYMEDTAGVGVNLGSWVREDRDDG